MKYEIRNCEALYPMEVAEQMFNATGEIGKVVASCLEDYELRVEYVVDEGDPRIDGRGERIYQMRDIEDTFVNPVHIAWAKDENGDDVLLCFN